MLSINKFKDMKFDMSQIVDKDYKEYLFDLIEEISEEYLKPSLLKDVAYSRISEYNLNELLITHQGIIVSEENKFYLM